MHGGFVGYIQSVCVAAGWRNTGIGSQLMAFAEKRIFSETPNAFILVSSFNQDARRLYERLGYEVVGELKDYIISGHSEILLRKAIAPLAEFEGGPISAITNLSGEGGCYMEAARDIDSLIHALYESISGPAGQERQWGQMRHLFFPQAHMVRTSVADDGTPQALVMDVETYIETTSGFFQQHGFYEREIARRTDRFGNIAHVLSSYEARHSLDDPEPFRRGINSIQLFYDGQRWWIINMLWDNEREENPMPEKYLASG
jgi:N-acetylglutamate synthase-like GNAT family acetyltransferase